MVKSIQRCQAETIHNAIIYLARLHRRMGQAGLWKDDKLFDCVTDSDKVLRSLGSCLHDLSSKADGEQPERVDEGRELDDRRRI